MRVRRKAGQSSWKGAEENADSKWNAYGRNTCHCHRPNSRLLKKALRLKPAEDAETAMEVNGATITDNYWFCPSDSTLTYDEIRFRYNYFDRLALCGDPNGFSQNPSRTPELTNIESFEKCWRWMDTLCYNMDRHTKNFGILRSQETGEILRMAPNYDNNIALISRGYVKDICREKDGLIRFFIDFLTENEQACEEYRRMLSEGEIPVLDEHMVEAA